MAKDASQYPNSPALSRQDRAAKRGDVLPGVVVVGKGQKCKATNRRGAPCGRWAIPGGTVCLNHGGGAPQVREAARRRLMAWAPRALQVLEDIAEDTDQPAAARVRAASDLLDRAGFKPVSEIEVTAVVAENEDLDRAISEALAARGVI